MGANTGAEDHLALGTRKMDPECGYSRRPVQFFTHVCAPFAQTPDIIISGVGFQYLFKAVGKSPAPRWFETGPRIVPDLAWETVETDPAHLFSSLLSTGIYPTRRHSEEKLFIISTPWTDPTHANDESRSREVYMVCMYVVANTGDLCVTPTTASTRPDAIS